MAPVFPFTVLNYAFGVTDVPLRHYVVASWAGMIPGTIMYVYLGSLAGDLAAVGERAERTPMEWFLLVVALIATIAVTLVITRAARRALNAKVGCGAR